MSTSILPGRVHEGGARPWKARGFVYAAVVLFLAGAPAASAVRVAYTVQTANFNQLRTQNNSGGWWDSNSSEMGMWANGGGGNNGAAAFQTFTTSGVGSGSARPLQVGDEFIITTYSQNNPWNWYGISFNDSTTYSAFTDLSTGRRMAWELGSSGNYYVIRNGGNTDGGAGPASDRELRIKVTASDTFTAQLGGSKYYDLTMLNSPATSARIQSFCLYVQQDNGNKYWKGDSAYGNAAATLTNTYAIEFGGDNGTRTINGLVADGLEANSTSAVSTNRLYKIGTGTVTLGNTTNTYTGGSQIENGVLQGSADRSFGIAPAAPSTNHFNIWSSGTLQFTGSFVMDTNRGIMLGNVTTPKIGVTSGNSVTYGGSMVGTANWHKVESGTLVLTGISSNLGVAHVTAGLLVLGQDQAAGAVPGGAEEKINIWSTGTLGFTNTFTLHANRSIELGAVSGPRLWVAPGGVATVSGTIQGSANWTNIGPGTLVLSNNTFSGSLTITQGVVRLVHTNGLGTVAAGTVVNSGAALELSAPGNYPAEALTLSGTGIGGAGALRKVDATGRNYAGNITLAADAKIAVDAGGLNPSGLLNLGGNTLYLDTAASFQMLSGSTISNATKTTGDGAIVKTGTSFFILRPTTDLTGNIALNGGEIRVGPNASGSGLIAGGTLTMAAGTKLSADSTTARTVAKNMVINGGVGLAENSTGGLTLSGTVGLGGATRVATNSNAVTITGVISNGGLEKKGAGTLTLLGTNTYAGGTTVSAGTLQGNAASLQGPITNNSAVVFDQVTTGTYAGVMSGTGTLTKQADGAVILTAASTVSGATAVNAGILAQNGTNTASAVTVAAGATLMGGGRVGGLTVTGTVRPNPMAAGRARLQVASLTMNDTSAARFRIGDVTDLSDRDFIVNDGAATINATTTIYLEDSQLANWNPAVNYTWTLIQGGIASAANFVLNTNTYWSAAAAGGEFTLDASGGNLVLDFTASTSEPSTQASAISFSLVGVNGMTVSWTPGDGANRVVVARAGGAVDDDPDDAATYAADANFGDGDEIGTGNFVVFNGSGSSVPVTGLSPDTVYHFRVYEYNGSGGGENYNTNSASGNPASQTTLDTEPTTQATALEITAVGETTMSLGWTRGDGENVLIVGRLGAAAESPPDGTNYTANAAWGSAWTVGAASRALYAGSGTSENLTGLSAETLYYFTAFEFNGTAGANNYLTTAAPTTNLYTLSTEPSAHAGSFTATAVSKTQIDLSWSAAAGADGYLILIRPGVDPSGSPTDGRAYSVGGTFGSDTITGLVAGTSFSAVGLAENTQYNFSIIPYNWNGANAQTYNYRTAATIPTANDTTWSRASRVIKEPFNSYADFNNLAGANGGTGWDGAWAGAWDEGDIWIDDVDFSVPLQLLPVQGGDYARKAKFDVDSNGKRSAIRRKFEAITSGQFYATWIMQGGANDAARFWGVSFGTNEAYGYQAFGVGKTRNDARDLGISIPNMYSNETVQATDWDLNSGSPYILAVKYDFDTDLLQVMAWANDNTDILSMQEPVEWVLERSMPGIEKLDQLFLEAGSAVGDGNAGECFFDHIRIGTNWYEVMVQGGESDPTPPAAPTVQLAYIGTNYAAWPKTSDKTELYDGELADTNKPIDFAIRWTDSNGLFVTNDPASVTNISANKGRVWPNWDPLSIGAVTSAFGYDRIFTNAYGANGDGSVTTYQYAAFSITNIDFANTYYVTVSGENDDQSSGEYTADPPAGGMDTYGSRGILVNYPLPFTIRDDDTNVPSAANIYSVSNVVETLRILHITAGTSNAYLTGDTTNRLFRVDDGDLAALSATFPLRLSLGVSDTSGVARGATGDSATNMSLTIGSVIISNTAQFSADESTPAPALGLSTNVWRFESLTYGQVGSLFAAGTNVVRATLPDADGDRVDDQMVLTNQQYGYLAVRDDDVLGPALGGIDVDGAPASGTEILGTGFEASEGWPIQGSGDPWEIPITNGLGTGVWHGTGYVNIGDPRSGVRKGGMTTSGVGQYFEPPPRDNPGTLKLWARLSSAGSSRHLAVERFNGTEWVGCGTNTVSSDTYQQYSWEVDTLEASVTVRVIRVGTDGSPGIYMDDLTLESALPVWLSTTEVTSRWYAAVDASGVQEYRGVAPAYDSSAPNAIDAGVSLGADTTTVFDVTGLQGVLTGFVFSVDNDNDRANDRMYGNNSPFIVRIDTNPPPQITGLVALDGEDPTSEAVVQWVAATDAGERTEPTAATLSPWAAYRIYYTDDESDPTTSSAYIDDATFPELTNITATTVIFSNLIFDTTYKFKIAGRDQAGNWGPLSDTATILLPGFNITQGVVRTVTGIPFPRISWKSATNLSGGVSREYDLLWVDAGSFANSLSNQWKLLDSGWTNTLADTGTPSRTPPVEMVNTMRFYRAANKDRWLTNRNPRVGSEEVYGLKRVRLYRGQNWLALPVDPDSNTVKNVLGIDLPGGLGASDTNATWVLWYARVTNQLVERKLWLADLGASNQWRTSIGFPVPNQAADHVAIDADKGFVVVIPSSADVPQNVLMLGRVPTNTTVQEIHPQAYNLVSHHLPVRVHPSQMNLLESGFQGSVNSLQSDRLRKIDPETQSIWNGRDVYYDPAAGTWKYTGAGGGVASDFYIYPDESFLIYTRGSTESWFWTNKLPYSLPTRTFSP